MPENAAALLDTLKKIIDEPSPRTGNTLRGLCSTKQIQSLIDSANDFYNWLVKDRDRHLQPELMLHLLRTALDYGIANKQDNLFGFMQRLHDDAELSRSVATASSAYATFNAYPEVWAAWNCPNGKCPPQVQKDIVDACSKKLYRRVKYTTELAVAVGSVLGEIAKANPTTPQKYGNDVIRFAKGIIGKKSMATLLCELQTKPGFTMVGLPPDELNVNPDEPREANEIGLDTTDDHPDVTQNNQVNDQDPVQSVGENYRGDCVTAEPGGQNKLPYFWNQLTSQLSNDQLLILVAHVWEEDESGLFKNEIRSDIDRRRIVNALAREGAEHQKLGWILYPNHTPQNAANAARLVIAELERIIRNMPELADDPELREYFDTSPHEKAFRKNFLELSKDAVKRRLDIEDSVRIIKDFSERMKARGERSPRSELELLQTRPTEFFSLYASETPRPLSNKAMIKEFHRILRSHIVIAENEFKKMILQHSAPNGYQINEGGIDKLREILANAQELKELKRRLPHEKNKADPQNPDDEDDCIDDTEEVTDDMQGSAAREADCSEDDGGRAHVTEKMAQEECWSTLTDLMSQGTKGKSCEEDKLQTLSDILLLRLNFGGDKYGLGKKALEKLLYKPKVSGAPRELIDAWKKLLQPNMRS